MKKNEFSIIGTGLFIGVFVSASFLLQKENSNGEQPIICPETMQELNQHFLAAGKNKEFMGYLSANENGFCGFSFAGTKNLENGEIEIAGNVSKTDYSIHSHPNGWCIPSEQDKASARILNEKKSCIMCNQNTVRCYLPEAG